MADKDISLNLAKECLGIDSSNTASDAEIQMIISSVIASFSVSVAPPEFINSYDDMIALKISIEMMMVYDQFYHTEAQSNAITYQMKTLQAMCLLKSMTALTEVTYNLTNIASSNASPRITIGEEYNTMLYASEGYALPPTVSVAIGGTAISTFSYSSTTGLLHIDAQYMTADMTITAAAVASL